MEECGPRSANAEAAESHNCIERSYIQMMATKGACVAFNTTIRMALTFSEGRISRKGLSSNNGMRLSGGMK